MFENQSSDPPLDSEDWAIAFAPYAGNQGAALRLACLLMVMKAYLAVEPLEVDVANKMLDEAIEVLFPYTQFHGVSHDLFIKLIGGKLTLEEEEKLKALGIKF